MSNIQDFNFSINLLESLLWQYNEAETLESILQQKQDWTNENYVTFWEDWYNNVFNLETANDFGLDVWAKILDVNFVIPPGAVRNTNLFGFGVENENFFNSNFSPSGNEDTEYTTEQRRLILRLTYIKYVSRGTVPETNKILTDFFGFKVYILDNLNMTGTVIFSQTVAEQEIEILEKYDLIPRPAGVKIDYSTVTGNGFGFKPYGMNFFNGYFAGSN